jgi:hypothetical protein
MVIDWSTWSDTKGPRLGDLLFCPDFAPTASVLPAIMVIDKWARWGRGALRNRGALGQSVRLTIFFLQNRGPVHHNIYVNIGITFDCIST